MISRTPTEVLTEKRGVVEALGVLIIIMTLLVAVGGAVANYAILSKKAAELSALELEVTNRAEIYAAVMNSDLLDVAPNPSELRDCSIHTGICTQILSVVDNVGEKTRVLRIQADTSGALGQTVVKDVTLVSAAVTHITAVDTDRTQVWANTNEGRAFTIWSVAKGDPTDIADENLEGPQETNRWITVDDQAGIDSAGQLWAWGENTVGQAGIGHSSAVIEAPKNITPSGISFRTVVTGDQRAYAIDSTGNLWAWGRNTAGELGLGTNVNVVRPTKVPGVERFFSVAIGKDDVIALTTEGVVMVAGAAQRGFADVSGNKLRVLDPTQKYIDVSASVLTTGSALIREDGVLVLNGIETRPTGDPRFTTVARGAWAGYAISTEGYLYSWGLNDDGQLGDGTTTFRLDAPAKLPGTRKFIAVQGNLTSAVAIDATGALFYTGTTPAGHKGFDLPKVSTFTPLMPERRFADIAGDDYSSAVALRDTAGNLYSMGTDRPGLWTFSPVGPATGPIRMPVPDDFLSYTWK